MKEKKFEPIDLSDLIEAEQLKTVESLADSIEAYLKRIVDGLIQSGRWKLAASYARTLVTRLGDFRVRVVKLRNVSTRKISSPMLDFLSIRRREYSTEVRILLADMATRLSYGDSEKQFKDITGVEVPKRTIHSFVQEIGRSLKEEFESSATRELEDAPMIAVLADGTKTRSIYRTQNNVKIAMKYDQLTREKSLASIGVNNGWIDAKSKTHDSAVIVSDAEEEIPKASPIRTLSSIWFMQSETAYFECGLTKRAGKNVINCQRK